MTEQRVKTVNFDICKKAPELISYRRKVSSTTAKIISVFTARRYAERDICCRRVSVCVCVYLSHSSIVSKQLNVESRQ